MADWYQPNTADRLYRTQNNDVSSLILEWLGIAPVYGVLINLVLWFIHILHIQLHMCVYIYVCTVCIYVCMCNICAYHI